MNPTSDTAAAKAKPRVRVFLVEDQTLFSSLLLEILAAHPRFEVVGSAATAGAALEALATVTPDLVLLDLVLPDRSGLEVIEILMARRPTYKIVVCSAAAYESAIAMAFALGAHGFVEKTMGVPELLDFLERSADGMYCLSPRVSEVLRGKLCGRTGEQLLLSGDLGVLRRLAQHEPVREIAREMGLSTSGVYKVRQRIARCVGARNKRDLYLAAVRLGLVEGPPGLGAATALPVPGGARAPGKKGGA